MKKYEFDIEKYARYAVLKALVDSEVKRLDQ